MRGKLLIIGLAVRFGLPKRSRSCPTPCIHFSRFSRSLLPVVACWGSSNPFPLYITLDHHYFIVIITRATMWLTNVARALAGLRQTPELLLRKMRANLVHTRGKQTSTTPCQATPQAPIMLQGLVDALTAGHRRFVHHSLDTEPWRWQSQAPRLELRPRVKMQTRIIPFAHITHARSDHIKFAFSSSDT